MNWLTAEEKVEECKDIISQLLTDLKDQYGL